MNAELLIVALGLVGRLLAGRWPRVAGPVAAAIAVVGTAASLFRDLVRELAEERHGDRYAIGWAADHHADACRVLVLAALSLALLEARPEARNASRGGWLGALLAAGVAGVDGRWAALAAVGVLLASKLELPRPLTTLALVAGTSEALFRALGLYDPADAAQIGPAMVALAASVVAGMLHVLGSPLERAPCTWALWGAFAVGVATTPRSAPHPGLDAVAEVALPVATPRHPYRLAQGCLVVDGHTTPLARWKTPECPNLPGYPPGRRRWVPVFALPADAPLAALAPAQGGDVELLVRLPGFGMPRWRVARLVVPVWELAQREPAYGPLATREVVVTRGVRPEDLAIDPDAEEVRRVDVVVTDAACDTVGCLVDLCLGVEERVPFGVRCGYGPGEPAAWDTLAAPGPALGDEVP